MSAQIRNTKDSYGSVAKFFHWLIFILVLIMIVGGFFMSDLPKEYKGVIYNLHKLTGVTILFLMIMRILWALVNTKPSLEGISFLLRLASRSIHYLLYLAVIAMPLVGWIGASAVRKGPHIGNLTFTLPVPESKELSGLMFTAHDVLAYIIIALVSMHVAAALYHHYVVKDNILRRMLPGKIK